VATAVFVFGEEEMKDNHQDGVLDLGKWLGRRQAFSLVAGRCSAADAKCLRELRESKKYKLLGLTWEECCKQLVGICRSVANLIIQNLEEFGPDYFVIAQVTGISADEYRRISGSVSHHALLHAGEEIPIELENAPRLVAAVEDLRLEADAARVLSADAASASAHCFARAERALRIALAELDKLRLMPLDIGGRMRLQTAIGETAGKLKLLDMQVKL
jgi:hypothetical protein